MSRLKSMVPYLLLTSLGFYVLPALIMGNGLFLMLIALPALVFGSAIVYGLRNTFHWSYLGYALIVGVLFLPTVYLYYNSTALLYTAIFGVIAFTGSILGRAFTLRAV